MLTWLCCCLLLLQQAHGSTILHLADFHLDIDYSTKGDNTKMCHEGPNMTRMSLGTYGDYMCDSPQSLVDYTLGEAKRLFPAPDLILWTGDNVPHIDNYDWSYVFNAVKLTTELVKSKFPSVPVIATFGNHDYAPANAYDTYSNLYSYTWEYWSSWIGKDQKDNFLRGGYYKYSLPNVTILVLNTNLYYNGNSAFANFSNPDDPGEMFAFMESELEAAMKCPNRANANCTNFVHIVAHIPPGVFERTPHFSWFRPQYNKRFLDITVKYSTIIKWMIYGHHHTDTFHLVRDPNGTAVQLSLMAPAVTPWFSSLSGAGANNPAFRVYETTNDMLTINDIRTYYVNLDQLNSQSNASFVFEYSFKDAYNIPGMIDATAMDIVLQRMKTDNATLMKYLTYNSVNWQVSVPQGVYLGAQLCSIEFSDYDRYEQCMLAYSSAGKSLSFLLVTIVVFVLNVLLE